MSLDTIGLVSIIILSGIGLATIGYAIGKAIVR